MVACFDFDSPEYKQAFYCDTNNRAIGRGYAIMGFCEKTLYKLMMGEEVGLDEIIKILFGVML